MILLVMMILLFVVYIVTGIADIYLKYIAKTLHIADILLFAGLAIPFLYSVLDLLIKHNLKIYFWFTRIKNRIKNPTAKWNINVQYYGKFDKNIIDSFANKLLTKDFMKLEIKIMHRTNQSVNFSIAETMNLYLEYENASFANTDKDSISIKFSAFEISCNSSEKKLNQEIMPLLEQLRNFFNPQSTSYTLNINFMGKNPFYTVFIDHLRLGQIDDFNVNLNFNEYSSSSKIDRVSINKEELHITTSALNSLKELAKDFIFLSPDLSKLLQC